MTTAATTYDLVLLLDPQAEDGARAKILADTSSAIEAQGELLRHDEWGTRTLAYPINRKTVAEYHMMQFHASSPDLLRQLDRSLRLADEAIRHRIIKLKAGVPDPPDMRSSTDPLRASANAPAAATPAAEPPPGTGAPEAPRADAGEGQTAAASAPPEAPSADAGEGQTTVAGVSEAPGADTGEGQTTAAGAPEAPSADPGEEQTTAPDEPAPAPDAAE